MALRVHAGRARQRRPDRGAGPAGEALVGDPAAVRLAAGAARPREAIERAVDRACSSSSTIFLFATGIANIQYWYVFRFDFVKAHYYAAVVFVAALAVHLVVKVPVALRAYRSRGVLAPLRDDLAETRPEPDGDLVAASPDPPTISRRGLLAAVGGGSAALLVANAGQSIGGPLREHRVPRAAARGRVPGEQDRGRAPR